MTHPTTSAVEALSEVLSGHWETPEGRKKGREYAAKTRADLAMPECTDLYLANALFLAEGDLQIQTAAKERMRWLSVQLALVTAERDRLAALERASLPAPGAWTEQHRSAVIKALDMMTEPGVRSVSDIADAVLAALSTLRATAGEGTVCQTCDGRGEIGGFDRGDNAWRTDPCPECAPPAHDQPKGAGDDR